jgi:hypothetical protein
MQCICASLISHTDVLKKSHVLTGYDVPNAARSLLSSDVKRSLWSCGTNRIPSTSCRTSLQNAFVGMSRLNAVNLYAVSRIMMNEPRERIRMPEFKRSTMNQHNASFSGMLRMIDTVNHEAELTHSEILD